MISDNISNYTLYIFIIYYIYCIYTHTHMQYNMSSCTYSTGSGQTRQFHCQKVHREGKDGERFGTYVMGKS